MPPLWVLFCAWWASRCFCKSTSYSSAWPWLWRVWPTSASSTCTWPLPTPIWWKTTWPATTGELGPLGQGIFDPQNYIILTTTSDIWKCSTYHVYVILLTNGSRDLDSRIRFHRESIMSEANRFHSLPSTSWCKSLPLQLPRPSVHDSDRGLVDVSTPRVGPADGADLTHRLHVANQIGQRGGGCWHHERHQQDLVGKHPSGPRGRALSYPSPRGSSQWGDHGGLEHLYFIILSLSHSFSSSSPRSCTTNVTRTLPSCSPPFPTTKSFTTKMISTSRAWSVSDF